MIDKPRRSRLRASNCRPCNAAVEDRCARTPDCPDTKASRLAFTFTSSGMPSPEEDAIRDRSRLLGDMRYAATLRIPKCDPPSQAA